MQFCVLNINQNLDAFVNCPDHPYIELAFPYGLFYYFSTYQLVQIAARASLLKVGLITGQMRILCNKSLAPDVVLTITL